MIKKYYPLVILVVALLVGQVENAFAQVTTQGGGTGSTSPSGILYGVTANLHLQTVKIGTGLTFTGGTLAATGGTSASTTLLADTNTFSGTTNKFTNAPIFNSLTGLLKGNGSSVLTVAVNGTDFTLITAKTCGGSDFVSSVTAAGVFTCTTPAGTTYTATAPIFVNGSVIGTSFSTSTFNAFTVENTFTNLFATNASSTNGTSTNFAITGAAANCGGTNALTTNVSGVVGCTAQPQGTVTSVSVATANGFSGSSSGGATPALTLTTTVTGLLKGNGTAISSAALSDFPTQTANTVIANGTGSTAVPTAVATSTFFGTPTAGTILAFLNGQNTFVATTTFSSGVTYLNGNVTNTGVTSLTAGAGISLSASTGAVTITNTGLTTDPNWVIDASGQLTPTSTIAVSIPKWLSINDQTFAYASSTNHATLLGIGAGGNPATTSATQFIITAVGFSTLGQNVTGSGSAFGNNALKISTTGTNNTAIGASALGSDVTGNFNTALGDSAGFGVTGDYNISIGRNANAQSNAGYGNIIIDNHPAATQSITAAASGNIGIGNNVFFNSSAANNQLSIGNLLFGTLPATTTALQLPVSGTIGVGTSTPFGKFAIALNNADASFYNNAFLIASSTLGATTTLFSISNTGSTTLGLFGNCSGTTALTTNSAGTIVCGAISGTGGAAFPFTPGVVNFGTSTNATSTPISFFSGIFASSTSQIASTTFSINGNVGIGSSSPTSPLTLIQGNTNTLFTAFTIDGVTAGAGAEMALNRGSNTGTEEANIDFNTNGAEFWQLGLQNNSSNDFELWDGADDPVFTIKGGTNAIGFGTTTPFGDFAINADFGDVLPGNLIFNVASSSLTATTSLFKINNVGSTTLFQIPSSVLKTLANGTIVAAVPGTDYMTNINSGLASNMVLATNATGGIIPTSTPSATAFIATTSTATSTFAGALLVGTTTEGGTNLTNNLFTTVISNAITGFGGLLINTFVNSVHALAIFNATNLNVFNVDTTATLSAYQLGTSTITGGTTFSAPQSQLGDFALFGNVPYNRSMFLIASSSLNATSTLFSVNNIGHVIASSTNPVVTCTSGTLTSFKGDDTHGEGVCGTASTAMIVTFGSPWSAAPICTVTNQSMSITSAMSYTITATVLTISQAVGLATDKIDFMCEGVTGPQ